MQERPFGSTGASFPVIGMGCWAIGSNEHGNSYGPTEDSVSIEAVERALEVGIEVFDTADVYGHGHSEELLGKALGYRGAVFTKGGWDFYGGGGAHWHAHYLDEALTRSLERLGRDNVALYQLHNPPEEMMRDEDLYAFLGELKDSGRTRWTGISVHTLDECLACADAGEADAVQVPVSILRQDTLAGISELASKGIAVIAREPLANGFLTGKYDEDSTFPPGDIRHDRPAAHKRRWAEAADRAARAFAEHGIEDPVTGALAFVLAHEVSVVIPGAKTAAHVQQHVAAGAQERLPAALLEELYVLGDELGG